MIKLQRIAVAVVAALLSVNATAQQKYVGGDISLLTDYEDAGSIYKDYDGNEVEPLEFFKAQGHNAMRLRLFVDPDAYTGSDKDDNAKQDIEYVTALGKRIKDAGFYLMVDFHYSDTWADPVKQWTPAAWADLTDAELYEQIYSYTKESLQTLVAGGATPDLIQIGNEISYGMLWGAYGTSSSSLKKCYINSTENWERFTTLLNKAAAACREVTPDAKIILHTERTKSDKQNIMTNFYTQMANYNVDYDVIGLSYYPYYHGQISDLETAIGKLDTYDKEIMIVEAGYPFQTWTNDNDEFASSDFTYAYDGDGQNSFTADLITMLNEHTNVTGLFWWWMDMNAYPWETTGIEGWYRSAVFWSDSGWPTKTIATLSTFLNTTDGINQVEVSDNVSADGKWYTILGTSVNKPSKPGIYVHDGKKVVVK